MLPLSSNGYAHFGNVSYFVEGLLTLHRPRFERATNLRVLLQLLQRTMALHECEAYWQDFLRQSPVRGVNRVERKQLQERAAKESDAFTTRQRRKLSDAITACGSQVEAELLPLLRIPQVRVLLMELYLNTGEDVQAFAERLRDDVEFRTSIRAYDQDDINCSDSLDDIDKHLASIREGALRPVEKNDLLNFQPRTWKDLPEEELAERLSKGEIIPRDEWIPGISKGKRPLKSDALKEHLIFGKKLREEGREAYEREDFSTAFIRYRQGVELVNWIKAENEEEEDQLAELYLAFLLNAAQAALKCERYQESIRACTTVIQDIDEHNGKARYRRGRAYLMLGMAKQAKDDWWFILKSEYSTPEAVAAARLGLHELRQIVSRSQKDAKAAVVASIEREMFSGSRALDAPELTGTDEDIDNGHYESDDFGITGGDGTFEEESQIFTGLSRNITVGGTPSSSNKYPLRKNEDSAETSNECNVAKTPRHEVVSPQLTRVQTRRLLLDLLDAYTSPPLLDQLNECRRLADFELRRVLIRTRKILPPAQKRILSKYGLCDEDHKKNMRTLEANVTHWKAVDEEVEMLRKDCWNAILGDTAEIDS